MANIGTGMCPKGFIDIKEIAKKLGVAKSTAWGIIKKHPDFPHKYKFGWRTSRWREDEVDEWMAKQVRAAEVGRGGP